MEFRDMETDKTDLELIREFQSGSSPAFDALYERYRRPLYGYVNRQMQGHTSQADDVFQQTWMRAIDNLSTYRDQEKFSAWLMRIAHNLIIDYYRSLKRRAEDELDETYGDTTADDSGEKVSFSAQSPRLCRSGRTPFASWFWRPTSSCARRMSACHSQRVVSCRFDFPLFPVCTRNLFGCCV